MATTLNKVRSGDPLVIPAATYNAFVDAARDHRERQRSATKDGLPDWRQTGIVLVRNDSGADRERFDVLGVSGPVITPTDNADAFKERVAIKGVTPTTAHAGRFVVLLEPVRADAFGRGCVDGVCVARVKMNDEGHVFAEAKDGQADKLESGAAGSACLLGARGVLLRLDLGGMRAGEGDLRVIPGGRTAIPAHAARQPAPPATQPAQLGGRESHEVGRGRRPRLATRGPRPAHRARGRRAPHRASAAVAHLAAPASTPVPPRLLGLPDLLDGRPDLRRHRRRHGPVCVGLLGGRLLRCGGAAFGHLRLGTTSPS